VPTGKVLVYEPSIRVPLLMRGPGIPRGRTLKQLVSNVDLAPTILDAAQATPGRVQDGRSLLDLIRDPRVEWGRELLLESGNPQQGLTTEGLRNYRWKYVEHSDGETELYDLQNDPDELRSLHPEPAFAGLKAKLAARLHALETCAGTSCRTKPALRLHLRRRGCRLVPTVRGSDSGAIEDVKFSVRRRSPAPFGRRRLVVRATVRLEDGRAVTLDKRWRACRRR
jgi:hypothetical protein